MADPHNLKKFFERHPAPTLRLPGSGNLEEKYRAGEESRCASCGDEKKALRAWKNFICDDCQGGS